MSSLAELLASQNRLTGVRANFVATSTGSFFGTQGSSREISNPHDLALLKHLRSLADVIVTDAATALRENYRPSRYAPIQVWSKSGNFRDLHTGPNLTTHKIDNAASAIGTLRQNFKSILLETGPTLTALLAQANTIDQLKITVTGSHNLAEANAGVTIAVSKLNLEYLGRTERIDVGGTQFFTFDR